MIEITVKNRLGIIMEEQGGKLKKGIVAEACGVTTMTIENWINEKSYPNVIEAQIIATMVGKDVKDIWKVIYGKEKAK